MADPQNYDVSYSFGNFQANAPTTPLPGAQVDNELANIAEAVAAIVASIKDVRRSDGALKNGIVTYDSLELGLQLTFDPTNGALVAAAVAGVQADKAQTLIYRNAAEYFAGDANASAAAAAASASSVNLSLYLPKAGNLAGIGNAATARANIGAPKADGSDLTGRLATTASPVNVSDWNSVLESGWYAGFNSANQPAYAGIGDWLVQTIAYSALWVTQIAYPFSQATASVGSVTPFRRHSYSNGGTIAWQPWESMAPTQIGSTIWVNGTSAPPGYVKENGALLSRASYPALYAYAAASGNIVSEASWTGGNTGAFSTGDLTTTFRIPDARGEFIRGYDDGRGVDSSRVLGARQADMLKDHTHNVLSTAAFSGGAATINNIPSGNSASGGVNSPNNGGTETRPRNIAKLACIKY